MQHEQNAEAKTLRNRGGKYLTFFLREEEYGIEILMVREIIGLMNITKVPQTPSYIKGVINLRGKVIPVVDLRLKFAMEAADYTKATCVIVVNVGNLLMGIVVDTVSEVQDIKEADIEEAPEFGSQVRTDFILGMAKVKSRVKILLDINKALNETELDFVLQAVKD